MQKIIGMGKVINPLLSIFVNTEVGIVLRYLRQIKLWHLQEIQCDDHWTYFPHTKKCYKYFASQKSWTDARKSCQSSHFHHGDLASVPDQATDVFLSMLTSRTVWLGGHIQLFKQEKDPGKGYIAFLWTDGTPFVSLKKLSNNISMDNELENEFIIIKYDNFEFFYLHTFLLVLIIIGSLHIILMNLNML